MENDIKEIMNYINYIQNHYMTEAFLNQDVTSADIDYYMGAIKACEEMKERIIRGE